MSKDQAVYTGLFLDNSSRVKLLTILDTKILFHPQIIAHHLTLKFKPSYNEVKNLCVGSIVKLHVIGFAADSKAQAVLCQIPAGLTCSNIHPHITVALADGVRPVYSNELLSNSTNIEMLPDLIDLKATIGWFDGRNDRFDFCNSIYE